MLTLNRMSRYQAFRWLWRFDSEARWFWFGRYILSKSNLVNDVRQNYRDFGATRGQYRK